MDEPVIDKEDVPIVQFLLTDILNELRFQTWLLEDDDGPAEEEA